MTEERLVAEIDSDLKNLVKTDPRPIKQIVQSALEREFATSETAAIERRIDEKKQRIQTLEREINERKRELQQEEDELSRLTTQLEKYVNADRDKFKEAREALQKTPKEPTNPAVKQWAQKLGVTPQELLNQL